MRNWERVRKRFLRRFPDEASVRRLGRLLSPAMAGGEELCEKDFEGILRAGCFWDVYGYLRYEMTRRGLWASVGAGLKGVCDELYVKNVERNRELKEVALEAIGVLNGVGIEPVGLKGVVDLFEPVRGHAGLRVTGDIDLFVCREDGERAWKVLKSAGWEGAEGGAWPEWRHHLPALRDGKYGRVVELHVKPYEGATDEAVRCFQTGVERLEVEGVRCWKLAVEERLILTCVHAINDSQFQGSGLLRRGVGGRLELDVCRVNLRHLLDYGYAVWRWGERLEFERLMKRAERYQVEFAVLVWNAVAQELMGVSCAGPGQKDLWERLCGEEVSLCGELMDLGWLRRMVNRWRWSLEES